MAQNVTIAGNQYPNVPSVLIPKTGGGGNAIFADPSVVTAVAADVASGKYFLDSSGVLTQGTASGGGGASNVVTGTFKGTTTGAAMDVTLNYSGSGYPVAFHIYPTGGIWGNGSYYDLIQRYAIGWYAGIKMEVGTTPTYPTNQTGNENQMLVAYYYKSSSSSATSFAGATNTSYIYRNSNATSGSTNAIRFKSATSMTVYIASTGYGFPANIEYTYQIIYSS